MNCAYRKSHLGQEAAGASCGKLDVRAIFSGNNRKDEKSTLRKCEQRCLVVSGSEKWNTCPRVGIAARIVTLTLRVACTGGEVRQLAVWQPRLPVPAGARAAVPVCLLPWPRVPALREFRRNRHVAPRLLRYLLTPAPTDVRVSAMIGFPVRGSSPFYDMPCIARQAGAPH
jgi:hypothetical protein